MITQVNMHGRITFIDCIKIRAQNSKRTPYYAQARKVVKFDIT